MASAADKIQPSELISPDDFQQSLKADVAAAGLGDHILLVDYAGVDLEKAHADLTSGNQDKVKAASVTLADHVMAQLTKNFPAYFTEEKKRSYLAYLKETYSIDGGRAITYVLPPRPDSFILPNFDSSSFAKNRADFDVFNDQQAFAHETGHAIFHATLDPNDIFRSSQIDERQAEAFGILYTAQQYFKAGKADSFFTRAYENVESKNRPLLWNKEKNSSVLQDLAIHDAASSSYAILADLRAHEEITASV